MTPSAPNGHAPSAGMLLNPKAYHKHVANGTSELPFLSTFTPLPMTRSLSESSSLSSTIYTPIPTSYSDTETNAEPQGRVKSKPSTSNENFKPSPDPRQLLNPKGFQKAQAKKMETPLKEPPIVNDLIESSPSPQAGSGTSTNSKRSFEEFSEQPKLGNLMDKLHNVEERQHLPHKKTKRNIDVEDDEGKKPSGTSRGSGTLGEYLKEERNKENAKGRSTPVVDLTTGKNIGYSSVHSTNIGEDDDDEISIVSEKNIGQQEVCYGRISTASVTAHRVPKPSSKSELLPPGGHWPPMRVEFRREAGKGAVIRAADPSGSVFGMLDGKTANALSAIMDAPGAQVRTQPRTLMRKVKPGHSPGRPCSDSIPLTINLYGPRRHVQQIGRFLGQHNIWLQTPPMVDAGIQTLNPHASRVVPNIRLAQSHEPEYVTHSVEEVQTVINEMFDSLKVDDIPEMEPESAIITPMLRHQKQALYFMTEKEKPVTLGNKDDERNTLWRVILKPNGQKIYHNIISGDQTPIEPPQVFGGILADMMGLGKTLSVLSLVVASLPQTDAWTKLPPETSGPDAGLRRCKTTLLVSPLSAVINWEEQIKTHMKPGALSYYVYHGSARTSDVAELADCDIVITTYSIVLSDLDGKRRKTQKSPLAKMNFFRIVLDEAHIIREQSTGQSQAVCMLPAQRRWAVTGTPVQNRLDDFGALTKFLRLKPLDDRGVFARSLLAPFKLLQPAVIQKLQLLVGSITLRRLKDRIDLPKRHDQVVKLKFSPEEQAIHDFFKKESEMKVKVMTGGKTEKIGGRMYHHILVALLRLRLISAHGKELLNEEDLKRLQGMTPDDAIDLDEEVNYKHDSRAVYEMFVLRQQMSEHRCSECEEFIGDETKEDTLGYQLPCHCLICRDCYMSNRSPVRKTIDANEYMTCSYCNGEVLATSYIITRRGLETYKAETEVARSSRQTKAMTHYGGPHTKTKALISQLQKSIEESTNLQPDEPPIKSVVFSTWTSHLNLIQIALEDAEIPFTRLDGSMSRPARTAALNAFSNDPSVLVLLVTIGAGGVGLNLTSASKVYVMEPQFNPAAESQAIDRIHRLGQKREVTTTRFIMEGSIEEKIQEIQRKKQSLADLSMDRGAGLSKRETALEKLQELRTLFK
jgi:hypothetical protein